MALTEGLSKRELRTLVENLDNQAEDFAQQRNHARAEAERLASRMKDFAETHAVFYVHGNDTHLVAGPGEEFYDADNGVPHNYGLRYDNSTPDFADLGVRNQPQFFCQECRTPWPCTSYLWATNSQPFSLVVYPHATPWTDPNKQATVSEAAVDHEAVLQRGAEMLNNTSSLLQESLRRLADEFGLLGVVRTAQTMIEVREAERALRNDAVWKEFAKAADGEEADGGERPGD